MDDDSLPSWVQQLEGDFISIYKTVSAPTVSALTPGTQALTVGSTTLTATPLLVFLGLGVVVFLLVRR